MQTLKMADKRSKEKAWKDWEGGYPEYTQHTGEHAAIQNYY